MTAHHPPAAIRAGDADRDATIAALGNALTEGRLDPAEHADRLARAATATTLDRLADLTADLPPAPPTPRDPAPGTGRDARRRETGYWLGGAAVMTAIWAGQSLKDHDWAFYWPAVPLGIWAAVLLTYLLWPDD